MLASDPRSDLLDREAASAVPRTAAVVAAAGRGERLGGADKVLLPLAGRPMLAYSLDALERVRLVQAIVLVIGEHTRATVEDLVAEGPWTNVHAIVAGGPRRQDSVAAGVAAVPASAEVVLIHDGARPLAPPGLFERCAAAASELGAAIAAVPVTDTLKRVAETRIVDTVARDDLWAAQTPQAFRRHLLIQALASNEAAHGAFTDEAGLFEALGWPVGVISGTRTNIKITHADDFAIAEALLAKRRGEDDWLWDTDATE